MRLRPRVTSLRLKLFLGVLVVQALMLAALTVESVDVMNDRLEERAQLRLDEKKRLLAVELAGPLARRDITAIESVLSRVRSDDDITYLAVFDRAGEVVARTGWSAETPLPELGVGLHDEIARHSGRFDTAVGIEAGGEPLGRVHFGFSTAFMESARAQLIGQAIATGSVALAISALLIAALSIWLARNLRQLTRAAERIADGDFSVELPVRGDDEIDKLAASFNIMAQALQSRVRALAENEAKFHAIADYSYDVELWIG